MKLKEANVRLDKREVHLNNLITECLKQAKAKAAKKEKKAALYHLKKKCMKKN